MGVHVKIGPSFTRIRLIRLACLETYGLSGWFEGIYVLTSDHYPGDGSEMSGTDLDGVLYTSYGARPVEQ